MYPSTSKEFKSVTGTGATSNRVSHLLKGAASGSNKQRTSRSVNLTTEHSPGSSSVSEDSPEKCSLSSSVSAVHDLKNLYCCDIPDSMMDRDLLLSHFEQFGHVVRIYLSVKRKSCTLHFDSHSNRTAVCMV